MKKNFVMAGVGHRTRNIANGKKTKKVPNFGRSLKCPNGLSVKLFDFQLKFTEF